jgi:hypothetical protein
MLEFLKSKLKDKLPHHAVVVFSSFVYVVCAILTGGRDYTVIGLLFLVFITSIFYHSYPHNIYFRTADWIASISFILYLARFVNDYDASYPVLGALAILGILFWIISEVSYVKNYDRTYNISHTLWHILSGAVIFLIVFYI